MKNILLLTLSLVGFIIIGCQDKQTQTSTVDDTPTEAPVKAVETPKKNDQVILCFGNSLTAGFGLDEQQAWPALLQNRLDSLGHQYTVVNAGISGETTAGGLGRIDWALNQKVDVFILELGANDMLRGLPVEKTQENLEGILDAVQKKNPEMEIIVAGMLSTPNMGKDYQETFNGIFPALAEKYDAVLIPFFLENVATVADLNLPDGKHPNVKGQKIVLETVWKAVEQVIGAEG